MHVKCKVQRSAHAQNELLARGCSCTGLCVTKLAHLDGIQNDPAQVSRNRKKVVISPEMGTI